MPPARALSASGLILLHGQNENVRDFLDIGANCTNSHVKIDLFFLGGNPTVVHTVTVVECGYLRSQVIYLLICVVRHVMGDVEEIAPTLTVTWPCDAVVRGIAVDLALNGTHQPTPDIPFKSPTTINGKKVCWLNFKTYYGTSLLATNKEIPVGKLADVAVKYSAHFGPGGFVFGQGFNADLQIFLGPSVILLDSAPLDLSEMKAWQDQQA